MPVRKLSQRQEECLRLSALMVDKDIARQLGISPSTVNKHICEAMVRLEVTSRKAALRSLGLPTPWVSGSISQPPSIMAADGATGTDDRLEREDPAWPPPRSGWRLPPPPSDRIARLGLVLGFSIIAATAMIVGVSVVTAAIDLAARFAPPTAT